VLRDQHRPVTVARQADGSIPDLEEVQMASEPIEEVTGQPEAETACEFEK
jgi:hypothetical protein